MVEYSIDLDMLFDSLGNKTRRDILRRVAKKEHSISELAQSYAMSFAGVAKHIDVLLEAKLIGKRREGKQYIISLEPRALRVAQKELEKYATMWNARFDALDTLLTQ